MESNLILIDAFKELINIGIGRAASKMSQFIQSKVYIYVPEIEFIEASNLKEKIDFKDKYFSSSILKFSKDISGESLLAFESKNAEIIANLIIEKNNINIEQEFKKRELIHEIGNICLNAIMGTLSSLLDLQIKYYPPIYYENLFKDIFSFLSPSITSKAAIIKSRFQIKEQNIDGMFIILIDEKSYKNIAAKIKEKYREII